MTMREFAKEVLWWLRRVARATDWTLCWRRPEDVHYPRIFLMQNPTWAGYDIVGPRAAAERLTKALDINNEIARQRAIIFGELSLQTVAWEADKFTNGSVS